MQYITIRIMLLDPATGGTAFGKEIMYPEVMKFTMLI
jgi:hypothetical protein